MQWIRSAIEKTFDKSTMKKLKMKQKSRNQREKNHHHHPSTTSDLHHKKKILKTNILE